MLIGSKRPFCNPIHTPSRDTVHEFLPTNHTHTHCKSPLASPWPQHATCPLWFSVRYCALSEPSVAKVKIILWEPHPRLSMNGIRTAERIDAPSPTSASEANSFPLPRSSTPKAKSSETEERVDTPAHHDGPPRRRKSNSRDGK
jgi:hypothetical protein